MRKIEKKFLGGTSGMGQAQSMTTGGSGCDDCPGTSAYGLTGVNRANRVIVGPDGVVIPGRDGVAGGRITGGTIQYPGTSVNYPGASGSYPGMIGSYPTGGTIGRVPGSVGNYPGSSPGIGTTGIYLPGTNTGVGGNRGAGETSGGIPAGYPGAPGTYPTGLVIFFF